MNNLFDINDSTSNLPNGCAYGLNVHEFGVYVRVYANGENDFSGQIYFSYSRQLKDPKTWELDKISWLSSGGTSAEKMIAALQDAIHMKEYFASFNCEKPDLPHGTFFFSASKEWREKFDKKAEG